MSLSESIRRNRNNTQIEVKEPIRTELQQDIDAWLAAGNQIQCIEPGVSGIKPTEYGYTQGNRKQEELRAEAKAMEGKPVPKLKLVAPEGYKKGKWLPEEDGLLVWLRSGNVPYENIRQLLNRVPRSVSALRTRYSFLTKEFNDE